MTDRAGRDGAENGLVTRAQRSGAGLNVREKYA
jgi:hypothetical protein